MTDLKAHQRVIPITGVVQHYAWGGRVFLPGLLGEKNTAEKPWAEYWLGVHPASPSSLTLADGTSMPLDRFIAASPEDALGTSVRERFGGLPYLLKVLDVAQMLSIQVHPDKQQARAGYAREEAAGIPVDAPNRNYKDDNHKPELMMALSEFWLLHGFKPEALVEAVLQERDELSGLLPLFRSGGYKGLYGHLLQLPQAEVNRMLQPLAERILPLYRAGKLPKRSPDFWAARAVETFCTDGNFDRGLFSIYLFNLVQLRPGEGIYQGAGLPHAYLEGQCVELMANSDNVLRAGLTPKHCDVPELLRLVRFEPTDPELWRRKAGTCALFEPPAEEFQLEHCRVPAGDKHFVYSEGPSILVVLEGSGTAQEGARSFPVSAGQAYFAMPDAALMISATEALTLFTASVPGV
ncbi:MAG: mannose-6-phosphate isomerase, class I [Chitinophagaceae bacterium]|nr:MAG: mannose-6-phosphate isomerase, class I [Chitinophagaceae bacterium]